MSEIRVGRVGKIVAGDEAGSYIRIVDDSENTGGFLLLTSKSPDMQNGFDNWVESESALKAYFEEARWVVDWSPAK
jgi:hypothetical protein